MNSFFDGGWGDEVSHNDMPFKGKKTYDIEISTHQNRFSVSVNGMMP